MSRADRDLVAEIAETSAVGTRRGGSLTGVQQNPGGHLGQPRLGGFFVGSTALDQQPVVNDGQLVIFDDQNLETVLQGIPGRYGNDVVRLLRRG